MCNFVMSRGKVGMIFVAETGSQYRLEWHYCCLLGSQFAGLISLGKMRRVSGSVSLVPMPK